MAARTSAQILRSHTSSVRAVAFTPQGDLVTGGLDQRAILWRRLETGLWGKAVNLRHDGQVRGVCVSPDGSLIATAWQPASSSISVARQEVAVAASRPGSGSGP